ncbi:MAG: hypothetical protein IE916_10610 [Epsilonproteobacteria bacterium]|nr:hypothetical protein [Campylobacterota bacterium]MBD3830302.1 hypothetical protein [Arcobacter sp.]
MGKFDNKKNYFLSLDKKFPYDQMKLMIFLSLDKKLFDPAMAKEYFYADFNANVYVLKYVKDKLSDELFEHIQHYELELDLADLFNIISTIEELTLHKKHKMSVDGSEYKREIGKIKKDADKISSLSVSDECEINLPQSSHSTRYMLIEYFRARGHVSDQTIKNISLFFDNKLPKRGVKDTEKKSDLYHQYGKKIIEEMMNGDDFYHFKSDHYSDEPFYPDLKNFYYYKPKKEYI